MADKKTVAVLHSVNATIPIIGGLLKDALPEYGILNWLDDSMLGALIDDPANINYVFEKLEAYSSFARRQGAAGILIACSSIGGFADYMRDKIDIPIVRIDQAMAQAAADIGKPILLAATLETTLRPSLALLEKSTQGKLPIKTTLLTKARELNASGGEDAHDEYIAANIKQALAAGETVVLAQASMAAAERFLPPGLPGSILTSPVSGVKYFANILRTSEE